MLINFIFCNHVVFNIFLVLLRVVLSVNGATIENNYPSHGIIQ